MSGKLHFLVFVLISTVCLFPGLKADEEPEGSWPGLTYTNYTAKGIVSIIDDLPIYTIGSGDKAIIFIYDIYGFDSGRTRQICDLLASGGYFVILPDIFRGDYQGKPGSNFSSSDYPFERVNEDLTTKVYPYLEQRGSSQFAMIGACFGGWIVFEASRNTTKVVGGISYHPSVFGKADLVEGLSNQILSPQLVIATMQEPDEVKEGGIMEDILEAKFEDSVFKTFNDMSHGFVTRGNTSDAAIKAAVDESIRLTWEFLDDVLHINAGFFIQRGLFLLFLVLILL